MARPVTMPQKEVLEEIRSWQHIKGECVVVTLGTGLIAHGFFQFDGSYYNFYISGSDYIDIVSANPAWAPGKPASEFRESDILAKIDEIRAR